MKKLISIVVPAYNEAENITPLYNKVSEVFATTNYDWEIIFVNDGSQDNTLQILRKLGEEHHNSKFISFSKNFGKDNALKAGIDHSNGDALATMDADLQHPPSLLLEMIKKWEEDNEVVFAYRKGANPHTSFFDKISSKLFWKMLSFLSGMKLEDGISDYRLLDKKVVDVIKGMNEFELFLRGMIKWVGFNQVGIEYVPDERLAGDSTYSKKALLRLAIHGITSFSVKPLYAAIYLGFTFSFLSVLYIPYVLYSLYIHADVPGWSSTMMTIVFFGGIQLIMIGVIGIYIGKMFMQSKNRPNYIIQFENLKK
jgi:dolichol-phosphate mannosyltransferase